LSANWFESAGDEKDALLNLDQGIRIYPLDDSAYNNMAVLVGRQGYLELARDLCQKGLGVNPVSKTCLLNLANCYWLAGQYDETLIYYKRASVLFPDSVFARDRLLEAERLGKSGFNFAYKPRNQKDYQQLALFYKSQGLFFLEGEAAQVGEMLAKKNP
jgi:tetratricopeptide (TPR) repeat protein